MSPATHDPERELMPGERVLDRFEIEAVLGRGTTSVVYWAHDHASGGSVALKVLKERLMHGTIAAVRFEREAQLVARLDHPAIVRMLGAGWLESRQPWLALEMLDGETLEAMIAREHRMTLPRVVRLLGDALEGLAAAHEARVLHRDLKPANLFVIDGAGGEPRCKLLDFGVSRDLSDGGPRLTAPLQLVGTVGYLAPEQLVPGGDPDERADLWAVAVVAYRALTGTGPFGLSSVRAIAAILEKEATPPSERVPELGARVDAFFVRALAKDRDERFASAAEMRAALRALVEGAPPA
ncbi:MAG: serine/threonine protein kinase [Myxococcota bacterium]|nr:serine/threonine protein kinase [Myxococcota bacterium]